MLALPPCHRLRALAGATALVAAGCGPGNVIAVSDAVTFRDHKDFTLVSADDTASGDGSAIAEGKTLGAGRAPAGNGASTDYVVRVTRAPSGAPELSWNTTMALVDGEHREVLTPGKPLVITRPVDADSANPWVTRADRFHLEGCTFLEEATSGGGYSGRMPVPRRHLGYRIGVELPCSAAAAPDRVPFALETPWSNVEIRRTITHYRLRAGLFAVVGLNVMFLAIAPVAIGAATKNPWVEGVGLGAAGLGLVSVIVALVLPSDTWEETMLMPKH